jgi:FMN-dependent NADH-azoreductase
MAPLQRRENVKYPACYLEPSRRCFLSTKVGTELAEKLKTSLPGGRIVKRDLVSNPLPHIEPDYASGIYTPPEARTLIKPTW